MKAGFEHECMASYSLTDVPTWLCFKTYLGQHVALHIISL